MKTSAVAANGKRRSLLPAPRSVSGAATTGVGTSSKNGEVAAKKNKQVAAVGGGTPELQPNGVKVEVANSTGDWSGSGDKDGVEKSEASSASSVLGEYHSSTAFNESGQSRLRKTSNLQRPGVGRIRPSSASSALSHSARNLISGSKTSGNDVTFASSSVKGAVASTGTKHHGLVRGGTASQLGSQSAIGKRKPPHSAEAATRKLRLPSKYSSDGSATMEKVSETRSSSYLRTENLSDTEPDVSMHLFAIISGPEDIKVGDAACALPDSLSNTVEGAGLVPVVEGQQCGDVPKCVSGIVSGVPDVLSSVTSLDDCSHLASSDGSLGIIDDVDLLDNSLLSFNINVLPSESCIGEVDPCCGQAEISQDAVIRVEVDSKQSSEADPPLRTDEETVPLLRPLSLVSNSSTDAGIVADCSTVVPHANGLESDCNQQQRPSSFMSTSSADTGMCCLSFYLV